MWGSGSGRIDQSYDVESYVKTHPVICVYDCRQACPPGSLTNVVFSLLTCIIYIQTPDQDFLSVMFFHYQLQPPYLCVSSSLSPNCSKCREVVRSEIDRRSGQRAEDLILIHPPLGMVDSINPRLRLDDKATVLVYGRRGARDPLVRRHLVGLDGDVAVLVVARVDLQALLVRGDVHLDARGGGPRGEDGEAGGRVACVGWAIEDKGVVDTGAVKATEAGGVEDGGPHEFGEGEVQCAFGGDWNSVSCDVNIGGTDCSPAPSSPVGISIVSIKM